MRWRARRCSSGAATSGLSRLPHRRITFAQLDEGHSRELADELLQRLAEVPPALVELVARRAEGNPFYMEELVKMLIDRGAIAAAGATWTLDPQRWLQTEIPATLVGVLQARLDSLPERERQALQGASVIGHVFWDQTLAALDARAPAALPALQRRELALPRNDAAAADDVREFAFSHKILHDVTYDTVLKRRRRDLHARAADWLASHSGTRASEWLAAAAEHYARAGEPPQAAEFFARAAEHARSRHAHEAALAHAARALALLDGADTATPAPEQLTLRWRLLVVREFTFALLGRRDEQRPALDAMRQVADSLDDDRARALAARRRSQFGLRTGDFAMQEAAAREAMAFAARAGADESRLEAQRLLADALGSQGRFAEGQALARAGLDEARALGLRRVEGVFLNALSNMAGLQDDQVAGLQLDLQDLPIWRELGDKQGEIVALANVGADWLWFGRLDEARQHLEEALRLCRAIGARQLENGPLVDLALLALWQDDARARWRSRPKPSNGRRRRRHASSRQTPGGHVAMPNSCSGTMSPLRRPSSVPSHWPPRSAMDAATRRWPGGPGWRWRRAICAGDGPRRGTARQRASGETWHGADGHLRTLDCHRGLAPHGDPRAAEMLASAHAE